MIYSAVSQEISVGTQCEPRTGQRKKAAKRIKYPSREEEFDVPLPSSQNEQTYLTIQANLATLIIITCS